MIPCCEVPVIEVTEDEAEAYRQFVQQYEQYWRTFFDPIAIRIRVTEEQYRMETIVLPLINNSIYTGMTTILGGETEPLDELPVIDRNIFSVALKFKKDLIAEPFGDAAGQLDESMAAALKMSADEINEKAFAFLTRGIGNQAAMHVCDASPFFDFSFTSFMGQAMGGLNRGRGGFDDDILGISLLIASLNSPVYVSIPVKDAKIVDEFLEVVDRALAVQARKPTQRNWFEFDTDFTTTKLAATGQPMRSAAIRIGPIKWRWFWARIGEGLYVASKPFILEDLAKLEKADKPKSDNPAPSKAHAMVRIRSQNWNRVLEHFQLGWSDSSREAAINNLSMLSNVARAHAASHDDDDSIEDRTATILREAEQLYGCQFFCPDGGKYVLSADKTSVVSSVYGTALDPKQPVKPSDQGPLGQALREFAGARAEISFLEDGLRALLTIDRKPAPAAAQATKPTDR